MRFAGMKDAEKRNECWFVVCGFGLEGDASLSVYSRVADRVTAFPVATFWSVFVLFSFLVSEHIFFFPLLTTLPFLKHPLTHSPTYS